MNESRKANSIFKVMRPNKINKCIPVSDPTPVSQKPLPHRSGFHFIQFLIYSGFFFYRNVKFRLRLNLLERFEDFSIQCS